MGDRKVLLGIARLPKEFLANNVGSLLLELAVDTEQGRIANVATNISLPSYGALLSEMLVGLRMDELGSFADEFSASYRGPLVKPTLAALMNAEANEGTASAV